MPWEEGINTINKCTTDIIGAWEDLEGLLSDLVDLEDPKIDELLDKYEVKVEGKYPRG